MKPDYAKWIKRDLWQLHEAVTLVLEIEPIEMTPDRYGQSLITEKIDDGAAVAKWKELYGHSKDAITIGLFKAYSPRAINWWGCCLVDPRGYLAWAYGRGESLPAPMLEYLSPSGHVVANPFKDMKLTADEIGIRLLENDLLEVSARGVKKRVGMQQIGLINLRTGKLNRQGGVLIGMANRKKIPASEPKTVSRLRKALTDYFGIKDDPFDKTGRGWEPRFTLEDARNAADSRAKQDGIRRTSSYNDNIGLSSEEYSFDKENDDTDRWIEEHASDPEA